MGRRRRPPARGKGRPVEEVEAANMGSDRDGTGRASSRLSRARARVDSGEWRWRRGEERGEWEVEPRVEWSGGDMEFSRGFGWIG